MGVSRVRGQRRVGKSPDVSARSNRDWFDWATLLTAAIGAVVVVTSTVLTQRDAAESSKRSADSLRVLTQQAEASQVQANAATRMATITSEQLKGLKAQLGEMKSQSTALSATADAANNQLREASRHNRLSVRPIVGILRQAAVGGEVGIYIYNSGTGPAMIRDLEVYFDGKRLSDISELEHVEASLFPIESPKWNSFRKQRTINASEKIPLYHTDSSKVSDMYAFADLIQNRISIVSRSCSLYEQCEYVCSLPNPGKSVSHLPRQFRKCGLKGAKLLAVR